MNRHSFWFLLITLTLVTSPALALPCLGKLERGASHYRVVDGVKCWYVGDRVPSKAEFTKRKEIVDRSRLAPLTAEKITPPVTRAKTVSAPAPMPPAAAMAMVEPGGPWVPPAEWFTADRTDVIDALCGTPCRVGYPSPAHHVQDVFDSLLMMMIFDRRQASAWRAALIGQ